jgi:biopolymer transport protein ExbB
MRIRPQAAVLCALAFAVLSSLVLLVAVAGAQDIREAARRAEADRQTAEAEAQQIEQRILADREELVAAVTEAENRQRALENELADLRGRIDSGERQHGELAEQWSHRELGFREISGNVRVVARDLESLLRASPLSAGRPERLAPLEPLLREGYFPDVDDIGTMTDLFFDEIARSGQVTRRTGVFVGRDGEETRGRIYQLGKFNTFYIDGGADGDETGFLIYAPASGDLFALAQLPARGLRGKLQRYAAGEAETVPMDISGGAALRQITRRTGFFEQLRAGGPIVWPILAIALAALLIVLYKIWFLQRVHGNSDQIMGEVNELAARGDWQRCDAIVAEHSGKNWPVVHVIRAGLDARGKSRTTLESVLQEAILHELPRLQRGQALLAVFGAVAPLLGLLGTVTGMIDTFRVITVHGTGDPKLMSGGISEALITTELGLAVAIPIMVVHTLLSRRIAHIIGEMEERAVALTNIVSKELYGDG